MPYLKFFIENINRGAAKRVDKKGTVSGKAGY